MVGRERWLAGVTVAGIVLAAALVCVLGLSDALPFGSDVALAGATATGFVAGLAALEGLPGLVALPFVVALGVLSACGLGPGLVNSSGPKFIS